MDINNKYTIYQSRHAWLVASTIFVSSVLTVVDGHYQINGHAAEVRTAQNIQVNDNREQKKYPEAAKKDWNQADLGMNVSGTESNQKNQEPAEGNDDHTNFLFDQRRPESRHQGPGRTLGATATTKSTDKIELESDKQGPEQNQKPSNTKDQEKDLGETNLAKQPLLSLYEQTTDAYEKLVRSLKTSEPNLNGGGDAVLDSDQRHIAKAGQMIFGEPDNSLLGLGSAKNDYSNVSQMRLMVDDSYTQKLTDQVRSLLGEEQKASRTSYFPNQNALVLGGGMPLTANIYSSNESSLNPERYYKMLQATLSAVANVLSVGMVHDKLTNNYDQGQYGVYLRVAVPAGVDPNEFLKTLNLDSSRFAAEMNFNATLGIDRLVSTIPGLSKILSQGLGLPVSGNIGSIVDLVLGNTVSQLNEKYGTNLSFKNSDSPFYPITIYPKATKVNDQEDPNALYLLVRGDELNHYSGAVTEAKILLTKFFMETLSWAGNIQGSAYGYLNFDLNRYSGNMSSQEMKKRYNADGQHQQQLADMELYADDSPYKILTRHQLPPQESGHAFLSLNLMDSNDMLARSSHDYGENGDLGRDIALRRADQKTVHPLPLSKVPTWRAYISLFDKEKVLNTKKVAGHSEEWAEVLHQEQVLPGQDLDHRVIKLSNGQNFYDQAGRFDRVIDYFDHQVLLDDQGFHPSKNVQSIRLVRSVDPAGQKTSRQDFAIYNRPFTVYYHGEMTLNNGETIPLRPTQLTVFQENLDQQSPLDSQRRAAFATIKKQGEYLFSLIQHLKPKLLDQVTADYGQKIQTVVSDANQKLDQGQTTTEIQLVQKDHLDQLMVIQNQATQNQPLAPALLNTNRDLAYQQLDQEALSTKVGINNAQRLNQEQKRTLLAKVGVVAQTGKNEIGLAPDVPAVRRVLLRNLEALRAIFVSQASKEDARLTLVQAGQKKKQEFAAIVHVNQQSLHEQEKRVDHEVTVYRQQVSQAQTVADLARSLADGLQAIDDVAKPELQIDYQPVSPDEVKIAVVALQEKGWGTKKRFREIAHTDSVSLRRQEKLVTEEINRGLMAIRAAQIKRELQQALDRALRAIDGVAQPQLIKEFQAVAATDRQRAIDAVAAAGQQKKQLFKKVVHVEPDSLNQQINFVDQLVKKAMISLQQAQTNRELVSIMVNAFKEINAVANPAKLIDYQPVSPNDVRHALAVLQQIGQEKSEFFNQIIGVDQRSLAKQQAELERVISNGIVQLKQAETNREFEQSFQGICQSIRAVAKPTIQRELQKVTAAEKTQSVAFLEQAAQRQRDSFKKIAHVDQKSLDQQLSVLDEVLKAGTQLINQAKTKGDFAKASEQALTAVRAVAKPVVEFDYQEVNVQAVSQAYSKLLDIVSAKQKQFKQILHVDPMSLVKQMQLLDTIMKATTIELNQSMIQKDIRNAYNKGAKALNLVAVPKILNQYQPVTSEERLLGQRTLQNACTEKKADFAAINHVDQERLEAQKLVLDSVLATGLQELQQAKTNASFRKTLATNLDRIQRVKKPSIQKDYQPVTDMNRYLAQQAINYAGQAKKQAIFAVKHGEQKSVQRQVEAVQKTVAQTQLAIIRAAVQGEVERAVKTGFELLAKVAGPVLEFDYQPVTLADRNQAFLVLNQAANNKKATFTAIDHVDPVNLSLQVSLIEKNRTNGQELLLGAKNKKDLRQKLATTLMHFDQVADPLKTIGYRQVEVSDQADAKNQLKIAAENQKQKFAALVGVDPESLAQQQLLVDQEQALANHSVDQSRTDGELKTACQQGLAAIRQIAPPHVLEELQPASITDKKLAKDYLNQIVAKCQQSFRQINHVDQTSLTQQLQLLNQASEQGKKSIDEATTKGALNQVLSHAEQAITRISQPGLHPLFQPVSQDEKAAFDDILVHQATLKKDQFTAIVHVDQESFSQQQQAIDQALAQAKDLVAEAKTKFDLNRAFVTGLQGIQDVAQPVIQVEFRPVVKADRKQALAIVNQAFLKKQKYFVGLQNVVPNSYKGQMAALKAARKAAVLMLSAVENQGQLHTALQAGLGALGQVAEPTLKLAYQPVSAADKIDIEKMLIQYGRAKQERFAKIAQVDPDSLEQQQQQIDHILDQVNKNLAQVKVNQELTTVQKQVLAKIDLVADPVLLSAYQLVTDRERAVAEQKITAVSQSKRADFWAIEHVDQQSLKQQLEQLADVLRTGQSLMQQAKVRYQFDAAVKQSLADIQSVAQPSIASEYRLARANQKVDAKQTLLLAAKEKVDYFAKLDGVDQSSLMIQKELLADIVQRYSALVDQVETVHDLHVLLNKAVQDVNHIKQPQQNWQDQAVNKDEIQTASQDVTATGENRMQDFGQIIGVDPTALSQQQQVVSRAVQDGLVAINLAKNHRQLKEVVQSIKNAIQKVQSPQIQWVFRQPTKADRQKAKDNLHQKANEQKQIFEKLLGVDAKSVAKQAATIDRIVQRAKQKLDEAVVNAGLIAIKQSALEAIGTVNQPNLLRSFQTIDVNEVNRAESVIQVVGDGLKEQFNAIENVDPVNLQQQINRIDQVITIAKKRLNGAKTNTAVDQIQGETLADLVSIAAPSALTLEREIREQAHRQIDWAGAKKQAEIDLLPRPVKLTYQTLVTQLRAILAQAHQAVVQAKTVQDLAEQLTKFWQMMNTLTLPVATEKRPDQAAIQAAEQQVDQAGDKQQATIGAALKANQQEQEAAMAQLQKILAHAHQQISQAKNQQDLDETVKAILDAIKATTNSKVPLTKLAISPVKDGTKVTRVGGVVIAADLIGSSKKSMVALVKRNDQKPVSSVLQPVEETKVTAQTKQLPLGFPENNDTKTNVSESLQKQEPVIHNNDLPVPNNEIGSSFSQSNLVSVLPQTNQQVNNRQSVKALILTVWLAVLTGFGLTKKQPDDIG